ncbi:hypothetical protein GCM10027594_29040 [Hymenobacter agri]
MKNLFTAFGLTAALAVAATAAHAQSTVSIGPRLGVNMATVATSGDDANSTKPDYTFTPQVGVSFDMQFGSRFAFQPSLLFSQKGFKTEESGTESFNGITVTYTGNSVAHINYLELPLNFVFTTGGTEGFQVFAGPYLALGVGGKATYSYTVKDNQGMFNMSDSGSYPVKFANQEPSNSNGNSFYVRQFDAGLNAGMGYRKGPVQVQLGYGLGLANLVPLNSNGSDSGNTARNRVLQLSANYFFGIK